MKYREPVLGGVYIWTSHRNPKRIIKAVYKVFAVLDGLVKIRIIQHPYTKVGRELTLGLSSKDWEVSKHVPEDSLGYAALV